MNPGSLWGFTIVGPAEQIEETTLADKIPPRLPLLKGGETWCPFAWRSGL
jgi:hypothetical protein